MTSAICTTGLRFRYGATEVLRGIDLEVPEGAIYGFLGPNGAGKTTLIRLLLGLLRPDSGEIRVAGQAPAFGGRGSSAVGAMIENPSLYPNLTAGENLAVTAYTRGAAVDTTPRLLDLVGLGRTGAQRVATFSLGMKQRLAIALALMGAPRVLILDEPVNGLDPEGIDEMRQLLVRLRDERGITILLSSHILGDVDRLASHVGILRGGRLAFQGTMGSIRNARLEIDCDDVAKASAVLTRMGIRHEALGDSRLAAFDVASNIDVNRSLVGAGVGVSGLATRSTVLEDFYHGAGN